MGPYRSGFAPYSSIHSATFGVSERSTDDASISRMIFRLCRTRLELVSTSIPGSTAREQLGTSTRAPFTSTTQMRHTFTGRSVSRKQSVGISMPMVAHAARIVVPSGTSIFLPSMVSDTCFTSAPRRRLIWARGTGAMPVIYDAP